MELPFSLSLDFESSYIFNFPSFINFFHLIHCQNLAISIFLAFPGPVSILTEIFNIHNQESLILAALSSISKVSRAITI